MIKTNIMAVVIGLVTVLTLSGLNAYGDLKSRYNESQKSLATALDKQEELSLTINQMNEDHKVEIDRLHGAMDIYVEQTKKDQIRLTELQNAIRGIEDEETKKCFDTRVPDAVLDSLFH